MASYNKVILMGNLTKNPEVRYIPSGTAVADLSLAVNEEYKGKDGEKVESVVFVDVVVWARQAETCGEYLSKGSQVLVEGSLQLDKWKTKEGENRSKLRVRATRIQFLGAPKSGGGKETGDGGGKPAAGEGDAVEPGEINPVDAAMADEDNLPF